MTTPATFRIANIPGRPEVQVIRKGSGKKAENFMMVADPAAGFDG